MIYIPSTQAATYFLNFIVMDNAPIFPLQSADLKQNTRWLRLAIGLWIALATAVCVKSIVQGGEHTVYPVYAWGSRHWWADQPLHAEYPELKIYIYRYSPTFAILFTPLALLPDWLGASLWGILSVAMSVWALRLMVREMLPGAGPPRREAAFLALTAIGSMSSIWSGQSNSLLLALVIFAAVAIIHQRWWTASCLLALPVFIKIWPLAAVLLFMAFWPKQLSWRFMIVAMALALLPFFTRPLGVVMEQYQQWYASLTGPQQNRWPGFRDAWTIWENLYPPVSHLGYHVLQLLSAFLRSSGAVINAAASKKFPSPGTTGHHRAPRRSRGRHGRSGRGPG